MNPGTKVLFGMVIRMLLFACLLVGVAYWHTGKQPDVYRATSLLVLDTLPFERPAQALAQDVPGRAPGSAAFIRTAPPHPISMPDYVAILLCDELMEQLRPVLQELQGRHGMGKGMPSRAQVRNALEVKARVLLQTPYDLYHQHTLELNATTLHPEVSAGLANAWAELGTGFLDRLRRERLERTTTWLREQTARLRGEETHIRAAMDAVQAQSEIANVQDEIWEKKQRIDALEQQLRKTPTRDETDSQQLEYETLQTERDALRQQVSQLEDTQRNDSWEARQKVSVFGQSLEDCKSRLAIVSARQEEAMLALGDATPVFRIVSRAYPPDQPSGPNRRVVLTAALLLGLILGPTHFLFMRAVRLYGPLLQDR